jgi:hypothetical protein
MIYSFLGPLFLISGALLLISYRVARTQNVIIEDLAQMLKPRDSEFES